MKKLNKKNTKIKKQNKDEKKKITEKNAKIREKNAEIDTDLQKVDEAVKNNRLALLAGLVAKANAVAAFNQLNTK